MFSKFLHLINPNLNLLNRGGGGGGGGVGLCGPSLFRPTLRDEAEPVCEVAALEQRVHLGMSCVVCLVYCLIEYDYLFVLLCVYYLYVLYAYIYIYI